MGPERQPAPAGGALAPPLGVAVAESPGRGRGVFATRWFRAGECIENAPVIVVPRSNVAPLQGTLLDDYWFVWDDEHSAFALGWVSLYNHACPANATFRLDHARRAIAIVAVADIAPGSEVTINYHGEPNDPDPVWFESRRT
jgi:SET domain-containing protein